MSIEVTCPNGHVLHVREKHAGKTGVCPKCQARVVVPLPQIPQPRPPQPLSDDDIVNVLGPPLSADEQPKEGGSSLSFIDSAIRRRVKLCPKCSGEVRAEHNVCPHCHTYFSS